MVKVTIYVEGGGDSKELHTRCREGFRKLLKRCGFTGRMPQLVACGGRSQAFNDFSRAHRTSHAENIVLMLVDSEDPMKDIEATWTHLASRDGWQQPDGTTDDQVLLMTTCMETWIVSDRAVLKTYYGNNLQESALPAWVDLESRARDAVQNALVHATRDCSNKYEKGKRSFQVLGELTPDTLNTTCRVLPERTASSKKSCKNDRRNIALDRRLLDAHACRLQPACEQSTRGLNPLVGIEDRRTLT